MGTDSSKQGGGTERLSFSKQGWPHGHGGRKGAPPKNTSYHMGTSSKEIREGQKESQDSLPYLS